MPARLRIFSYLPNPRLAKATITARLCGVELEIRGAAPAQLPEWLWDFDARPLSLDEREASNGLVRVAKTGFTSKLYKTEAFLDAHPFGTVPAAFSPDGAIGIFESNSIMRAIARLGGAGHSLYGGDPYTASRIDSFLDASLLFARDAQIYLLSLRGGSVSGEVHASAKQAFTSYMNGIERALGGRRNFIAGDQLSLADICFVSELALFHNESAHRDLLAKTNLAPVLSRDACNEFPLALKHFASLRSHRDIAPDIEPYLEMLAAT